jgi:hypothetical protein
MQRIDLITAANTAFNTGGIKTCYPFEIFGAARNSGTTPTTVPVNGSAISIGPILLDAYKALGKKAAQIAADLDAPRAVTFKGLDTAALLSTPIAY